MAEYTPDMAERFEELRPHQGESYNFWLRELIARSGLSRGKNGLEVGCGTGRWTIPVARETGAEMTGLDMSRSMLEMARRKSTDVRWVEGDAQDLPFDPGTFDTVTMAYALHQVPDRARAVSVLKRLAPQSVIDKLIGGLLSG